MSLDERTGAAVEDLRRRSEVDPVDSLARLQQAYHGRRTNRAVVLALAVVLAVGGVAWGIGGPKTPEPAPPVAKVTNSQLVTWNREGLMTVGEPMLRVPENPGFPVISFSGDGHELLYTKKDGRVVASNLETGTERLLGRCDSPCVFAGVSADTTQIALSTAQVPVDDDGLVVVSDSGSRRIDTPGVQPYVPVWSADGSRIAFAAPQGLYVVGADGSGLRQLLASADERILALPPSWSPDGRSLAYVRGEPVPGEDNAGYDAIETSFTLVTVDVASGATRELTPLGTCECLGSTAPSVAWSPDGRLIGFTGVDNYTGVFAIPAQGGELERLSTRQGGSSLAWRPAVE